MLILVTALLILSGLLVWYSQKERKELLKLKSHIISRSQEQDVEIHKLKLKIKESNLTPEHKASLNYLCETSEIVAFLERHKDRIYEFVFADIAQKNDCDIDRLANKYKEKVMQSLQSEEGINELLSFKEEHSKKIEKLYYLQECNFNSVRVNSKCYESLRDRCEDLEKKQDNLARKIYFDA